MKGKCSNKEMMEMPLRKLTKNKKKTQSRRTLEGTEEKKITIPN
jgi:hypothetical protein